jgi:hypothetical protein
VSAPIPWAEANQRHLVAALDRVRVALERHAGGAARAADDPAAEIPREGQPPPALARLEVAFGLSGFERDLLLLCAGVELDAAFAALCRDAQSGAPAGPTFGLALAALPGAHWSALAPAAPLRYWRLVEPVTGEGLTSSRLRIEERVLHFLTGTGSLDERLQGLAEPLEGGGDLPPSHGAVADRIVALWSAREEPPALVSLCGDDRWGKHAVAAAACGALGLAPHRMRAADVPAGAVEREALARLWEREAVLGGWVYERWGFGRGARGLGIAALFAGPAARARRWPPRCSPASCARPLPHRPEPGGQQVHRRDREEPAARLRRRRGGRRGAALRRGRRALRQAQRGEGQPRPLRQHRGQLPAPADGGVPRPRHPDDQPQGALDTAFLRRIRFVVHFPFPDAAQRAEIWRRVFPPETPTRGLDFVKLAR